MKLFGVAFLVATSIVCVSGGLDWDLGEWIPIPGRCATCDKGRRLYLHSESSTGPRSLLSSENKRRKKAYSSGSSTSDQVSLFALQPKLALDDDSSRVQLVYLPEGSINDLRTAKVAKVSKRPKKAHSRSVRSAPFPVEQFSFPNFNADGSRLSFREISPRRPTALVAERGKEREAQEQIQLLEAALNSPPEEVKDGELPRVFIAPTHLPPPPGYVKIPLLPNQNQVQNKRTLPGTFLTSEIHNQLPPGFVQVPLPEMVSRLSHSIPFVNPNTNPLLQGNFQQQNRQQEQHEQQPQQHQPRQNQRQQHQRQQHQPQDFGNHNVDFGQFRTDSSRLPQHFDSPQPVQQEFHFDQPVQQNVQTEPPVRQNIDVNQIARNHFNIRRPVKQNVENDKNVQSFDREQLSRGQDIHDNSNFQAPHPTFNQQQEPISQPEQQTVREHENTETVRGHKNTETVRDHENTETVRDHENTETIREHFQQEPLFETHSDSSITDHESQNDRQLTTVEATRNTNQNRIRQQRIRPQNDPGQSLPNVPSTSASPLTFKPHTNSFFEIGSSVIKPQNDFDYEPFNNLPDFNAGNDYGQDFALYDNQDFDFPINTHDKSRGSTTNTEQNNQEPSTVTHPQTQTSFTEDKVPSTIQAEDLEVITENPRIVPFQLSPKPIHISPTLSPSPIETVSKEPEATEARSNFEDSVTQKSTRIQLSPKPVEETETIGNAEETRSVPLNNRRRLRPTSFRGRTPSSSSRHRLNLSPKKVEDSEVTIGSSVVTKNVVEETVSEASPTTLSSLPTRNRFSNRRRRPFKHETTTKAEVVTESTTTVKPTEESSTLFPPFSVAKRLNENPLTTQETGSRRNPPSLRGRFGSRIRARTQESESPKIDETGTSDTLTTESLPPRRRGQRRRRLRARNGNGNGQPGVKRRRRILNKVRKINSESSDDNLNNQIQKEEQLAGAESARVFFSQPPLNKVTDIMAETSTSINDEKTNVATESIDQKTDNSEKKSNSETDSNIFDLLNLTPFTDEEINRKVSHKRSSSNQDLPNIADDTEGYVNNSEPLVLPNHSFDEHSTKLVSFGSQGSISEHDIGTLDTLISEDVNESLSPSSFDSLFSTLSQSTQTSPEPESSNTVVDDTHVEYDSSFVDLQHAPPHNPVENNEENIPLLNDNIHNILPENETEVQDNYYDYDNDNGTFLGSSAHVVYAVAISESPSEENDLTTSITDEIDSTADQTTEKGFLSSTSTDVEIITDPPSVNLHETTLVNLDSNLNPEEPLSEPLDEFSETRSILDEVDEVIEITESSISPSEPTINFVDTTSIANEIPIENITLPEDSNIRTENKELTTHTTISEQTVPEIEVTEESVLHLKEENDSIPFGKVDSNNSEVNTELTIDNNETKTEIHDESLTSATNNSLISTTENSPENITEQSSSSNGSLTNSFLNTFFPAEREGKENNVEVGDGGPIIIGKSTVTEVRSSAPVICIDGNCVIGAGIRKR